MCLFFLCRAMSSILLVKPDRMHEDFQNAFKGHIDSLDNYLKELFQIDIKLPMDLVGKVTTIIEVYS